MKEITVWQGYRGEGAERSLISVIGQLSGVLLPFHAHHSLLTCAVALPKCRQTSRPTTPTDV